MSGIQGNVNQLIGTAGILYGMTGAPEINKELKSVLREEKILAKAQSELNKFDSDALISLEKDADIAKKMAELKNKKFNLKPTKENLTEALSFEAGSRVASGYTAHVKNENIRLQEEAVKKAEEQRKAKIAQQTRYNDFVKKFTEGGSYK